ncbi:unnamed protein product [Owenia fusiformis]|uniref:Uncharacterized protein n=1 Tax=Owenia fusiformis TaxID=6347 RepID=A0A8S4NHC9_OWEFU|nr:unnamed protein product [Owenia fusiformis]
MKLCRLYTQYSTASWIAWNWKILFIKILIADSVADTVPECVLYRDVCVWIPSKRLNWAEAQEFCERNGPSSQLVRVTDKSFTKVAERLSLSRFRNIIHPLWIGATDKSNETQFQWADGTTVNYTDWFTGQPNDDGLGDDDCVELRNKFPNPSGGWADTKSFHWNDISCTVENFFICEQDKDLYKMSSHIDCLPILQINFNETMVIVTLRYMFFNPSMSRCVDINRNNSEMSLTNSTYRICKSVNGTREAIDIYMVDVCLTLVTESQENLSLHSSNTSSYKDVIFTFCSVEDASFPLEQCNKSLRMRIIIETSSTQLGEGHPIIVMLYLMTGSNNTHYLRISNSTRVELQGRIRKLTRVFMRYTFTDTFNEWYEWANIEIGMRSEYNERLPSLIVIKYVINQENSVPVPMLQVILIKQATNAHIIPTFDHGEIVNDFRDEGNDNNTVGSTLIFNVTEQEIDKQYHLRIGFSGKEINSTRNMVFTFYLTDTTLELSREHKADANRIQVTIQSVILITFLLTRGETFKIGIKQATDDKITEAVLNLDRTSIGDIRELPIREPKNAQSNAKYILKLITLTGSHVRLYLNSSSCYLSCISSDYISLCGNTDRNVSGADEHVFDCVGLNEKSALDENSNQTSSMQILTSASNSLNILISTGQGGDKSNIYATYEVIEHLYNNRSVVEGCTDIRCSNGGSCIALIDRSRSNRTYCKCANGFTGSLCMTSPCAHVGGCQHGICNISKDQCDCYPGWFGNNCTTPAETCDFTRCNGHGTCNGQFCECRNPWKGDGCTKQSQLLFSTNLSMKTFAERLLDEPFWIGVIVVLIVLLITGMVYCIKKKCADNFECLQEQKPDDTEVFTRTGDYGLNSSKRKGQHFVIDIDNPAMMDKLDTGNEATGGTLDMPTSPRVNEDNLEAAARLFASINHSQEEDTDSRNLDKKDGFHGVLGAFNKTNFTEVPLRRSHTMYNSPNSSNQFKGSHLHKSKSSDFAKYEPHFVNTLKVEPRDARDAFLASEIAKIRNNVRIRRDRSNSERKRHQFAVTKQCHLDMTPTPVNDNVFDFDFVDSSLVKGNRTDDLRRELSQMGKAKSETHIDYDICSSCSEEIRNTEECMSDGNNRVRVKTRKILQESKKWNSYEDRLMAHAQHNLSTCRRCCKCSCCSKSLSSHGRSRADHQYHQYRYQHKRRHHKSKKPKFFLETEEPSNTPSSGKTAKSDLRNKRKSKHRSAKCHKSDCSDPIDNPIKNLQDNLSVSEMGVPPYQIKKESGYESNQGSHDRSDESATDLRKLVIFTNHRNESSTDGKDDGSSIYYTETDLIEKSLQKDKDSIAQYSSIAVDIHNEPPGILDDPMDPISSLRSCNDMIFTNDTNKAAHMTFSSDGFPDECETPLTKIPISEAGEYSLSSDGSSPYSHGTKKRPVGMSLQRREHRLRRLMTDSAYQSKESSIEWHNSHNRSSTQGSPKSNNSSLRCVTKQLTQAADRLAKLESIVDSDCLLIKQDSERHGDCIVDNRESTVDNDSTLAKLESIRNSDQIRDRKESLEESQRVLAQLESIKNSYPTLADESIKDNESTMQGLIENCSPNFAKQHLIKDSDLTIEQIEFANERYPKLEKIDKSTKNDSKLAEFELTRNTNYLLNNGITIPNDSDTDSKEINIQFQPIDNDLQSSCWTSDLNKEASNYNIQNAECYRKGSLMSRFPEKRKHRDSDVNVVENIELNDMSSKSFDSKDNAYQIEVIPDMKNNSEICDRIPDASLTQKPGKSHRLETFAQLKPKQKYGMSKSLDLPGLSERRKCLKKLRSQCTVDFTQDKTSMLLDSPNQHMHSLRKMNTIVIEEEL